MKGDERVTVVLTDAAAEVVARVRAARGERPVARDRQRLLRLDGAVPVRATTWPGPNEREVAELDGRPVLVDDAHRASFDGREVVVDAGGDPQPDSFSCEAELGYRFFLDRLPAV